MSDKIRRGRRKLMQSLALAGLSGFGMAGSASTAGSRTSFSEESTSLESGGPAADQIPLPERTVWTAQRVGQQGDVVDLSDSVPEGDLMWRYESLAQQNLNYHGSVWRKDNDFPGGAWQHEFTLTTTYLSGRQTYLFDFDDGGGGGGGGGGDITPDSIGPGNSTLSGEQVNPSSDAIDDDRRSQSQTELTPAMSSSGCIDIFPLHNAQEFSIDITDDGFTGALEPVIGDNPNGDTFTGFMDDSGVEEGSGSAPCSTTEPPETGGGNLDLYDERVYPLFEALFENGWQDSPELSIEERYDIYDYEYEQGKGIDYLVWSLGSILVSRVSDTVGDVQDMWDAVKAYFETKNSDGMDKTVTEPTYGRGVDIVRPICGHQVRFDVTVPQGAGETEFQVSSMFTGDGASVGEDVRDIEETITVHLRDEAEPDWPDHQELTDDEFYRNNLAWVPGAPYVGTENTSPETFILAPDSITEDEPIEVSADYASENLYEPVFYVWAWEIPSEDSANDDSTYGVLEPGDSIPSHSITVSDTGTATIDLLVVDRSGLTTLESVDVDVEQSGGDDDPDPPSVSISGPSEVFPGDSETYTAILSAGENVSYSWGGDASGSDSSTLVSWENPGSNSISVTAENDAGSDTASMTVDVVDVEGPGGGGGGGGGDDDDGSDDPDPPSVSISGPGEVFPGDSATYTASLSAGENVSYSWGGDASGSGSSTTVSWENPGSNYINVTAENDAGSDTASMTVDVVDAGLDP